MDQYYSIHTGEQIDNTVTLIADSTDTSGINVPSSNNKLVTSDKVFTYTTCTLPVFAAAGSQNVNVSGITLDSHPILDIYIEDPSSVSACLEAWSHIYRADVYSGGITFYSDAATNMSLTVLIKGY